MGWNVISLRSKNKHCWRSLWNVSGRVSIKRCCPQTTIRQITSRGSVPPSGSGCRRARLSHLTDIWSISVHIWPFNLWAEKKKDAPMSHRVPKRDHSRPPTHPARVSKCHNLIICADLILSPRRRAISFKETPRVKSCGGFFCGHASFAAIRSPERRGGRRVWRKQASEARRGQIRNQQDVSSLWEQAWVSRRLSAGLPWILWVADGLPSSPGV